MKTTRKSRKSRTELGTLSDLAAALGHPISTVHGWVKHPEWRFSRKSPWSTEIVPDVLRWVAETLEKGRPAGGPMADLRRQKLNEEIRKLRAQADQSEMERDKIKGKLIPSEVVEDSWVKLGLFMRSSLEAMSSRIVPLAIVHGMPHDHAGKLHAELERLAGEILVGMSNGILERTQPQPEMPADATPSPVEFGA